jgi:molecular chaperone HtpG
MEFQTEQKQLMDIIIHSLYSHKEIFLRELISNACDAIDKVRFESLTNGDLLEGNDNWKIKLIPDKDAGTLTIRDNGIGMSRETIVENLGTIARSGTKAFLENVKASKEENTPDLIGQFGVGFYACFMVADDVTVISRMAGEASTGVKWDSKGEGTYTLEDVEKEDRGTDIVLHLKEDEKEFLEEWNLRQVVKKYSDFVEHPICMDVEREEGEDDDKKKVVKEETFNSQKALWLRSKSEVTEEEHTEFYKHLSHDYTAPLRTIHYSAEGTLEFKALLYLPSKKPMDFFGGDVPKSSLHLYVRRVQIMDDCDTLLPPYLRFVKGIVDSTDLPLNVSRELLQQNATLEKIQKNLVGKVLSEIEKMKKDEESEDFKNFYGEFATYLKEGLTSDFANRERLSELLMFESTKTTAGELTTLEAYVEGMKDDQEEIFYLVGDSREALEQSPVLEVFRAREQEVLLMTEPIDDWMVNSLREYKGKQLKAADKGEIKASDEEKKEQEEQEKTYSDLLGLLKEKLADVKEVRLSTRLKESAACLVADEMDMGANMERIMKKMGQGDAMPSSQRIMEINGSHEVVQAMQKIFDADKEDARLVDYAFLLYDQAVLAEGSMIKDPAAFAKRINGLMAQTASV